MHDVIRLIESRHGITLDELAEETCVNRRTIHRDLAAVQEAGYPIVSEWEGGRKVYRFLTRFKDVPPITFTLQELMTLSFFSSQSLSLEGTPFQDDMNSIFRKVKSVLPPRYAAHMERIAAMASPLLHGVRDYSDKKEELRQLRDALLYQYQVHLIYDAKARGEKASYEVDPYSLIFYKGGLYLLGYAHNRQGMRTFALERVAAVDVTKNRFEIPAEFTVQEQFGRAFGIVEEEALPVKVRFSQRVAHAVRERLWHPSQTTEIEEDGTLLLSFIAGGKLEILSWVLSYGEHAELLEPSELREEMARIVSSLWEMYSY